MFDTHAHLNDEYFDDKLSDVVKKAEENGVENILVPGTDLESSRKAFLISEKYPNIYSSCGIHPTVDLESLNNTAEIEKLAEIADEFTAVGEIGLDFYRATAKKETQLKFLKDQLNLALKLKKPVILHNRKSTFELLKSLEEVWDSFFEKNMVFHCTPPDERILAFAKQKKIYLGVDGDLTYDKKKQKFIKSIPLNLLVFETDSPYLTPQPLRSKEALNEPSNLAITATFASALIGHDREELTKITSENARILFNLND